MAFLTTHVPFMTVALAFGAMATSGAASLIVSLNKRMEKLEDQLEELTGKRERQD